MSVQGLAARSVGNAERGRRRDQDSSQVRRMKRGTRAFPRIANAPHVFAEEAVKVGEVVTLPANVVEHRTNVLDLEDIPRAFKPAPVDQRVVQVEEDCFKHIDLRLVEPYSFVC